MQRFQEEYDKFVDAILHSILSDPQLSVAEPIMAEDGDPIVPVIQIVRGHDLPRPRIQPWRFLPLTSRRNPSVRTRGHAPKGAKDVRRSRVPLAGFADPRAPNVAPKSWEVESGHAESRGMGGDVKLRAIYPVYQAIRRHIFRRLLSAHRSCIRSAAARMAWNVEGDLIARFCPAAEALLRWRMFWEGFGVPGDLFRKPRHLAFGLPHDCVRAHRFARKDGRPKESSG